MSNPGTNTTKTTTITTGTSVDTMHVGENTNISMNRYIHAEHEHMRIYTYICLIYLCMYILLCLYYAIHEWVYLCMYGCM